MYSTANGHLQQQPMQGGQAQMPNELDLKVKFRTDKTVDLCWNTGRHVLEDYPYKLQYLPLPIQVGITQPIQIPGDLFYTVKEIRIPKDQKNGVKLVHGKGYRFILLAKEKNNPNGFLYGVADVQMAGEPCTETIQAILESQDFMQKFAKSVDPCPKLHQAISGRYKEVISKTDYKNILLYADGSRKRITEELLDTIAQKCEGDKTMEEKIQVCQLLRVVKEYGPVSVLRDLFEWHTGRPDGHGPCQVCTREYFG